MTVAEIIMLDAMQQHLKPMSGSQPFTTVLPAGQVPEAPGFFAKPIVNQSIANWNKLVG